ncbi:hypothetical protein BRADI_3g39273v3 [Brachypodium distachyon]|uniref:Uncharacterized protein n=1 Tax=Brachypodium distachyon TaxID=15368 RepID=A0A2K2D258_BRADI|nr:hypothetical protein BRADI_3g39273v3 [Brachypodium distachyon]
MEACPPSSEPETSVGAASSARGATGAVGAAGAGEDEAGATTAGTASDGRGAVTGGAGAGRGTGAVVIAAEAGAAGVGAGAVRAGRGAPLKRKVSARVPANPATTTSSPASRVQPWRRPLRLERGSNHDGCRAVAALPGAADPSSVPSVRLRAQLKRRRRQHLLPPPDSPLRRASSSHGRRRPSSSLSTSAPPSPHGPLSRAPSLPWLPAAHPAPLSLCAGAASTSHALARASRSPRLATPRRRRRPGRAAHCRAPPIADPHDHALRRPRPPFPCSPLLRPPPCAPLAELASTSQRRSASPSPSATSLPCSPRCRFSASAARCSSLPLSRPPARRPSSSSLAHLQAQVQQARAFSSLWSFLNFFSGNCFFLMCGPCWSAPPCAPRVFQRAAAQVLALRTKRPKDFRAGAMNDYVDYIACVNYFVYVDYILYIATPQRVQVFDSYDDDYASVLIPGFLLNSGQLSTPEVPAEQVSC